MTYVLPTAKLDATGHRWLAVLAAFEFNIIYRPGKKNGDADALSRLPITEMTDEDTETIPFESVRAICNSSIPTGYVESLAVEPSSVLSDEVEDEAIIPDDNIVDWARAQTADPDISKFVQYVSDGKKPTVANVELPSLLRRFQPFFLRDGILYRAVTKDSDNETIYQLMLPSAHVDTVITSLHNDMGHPGKERTSREGTRTWNIGLHSVVDVSVGRRLQLKEHHCIPSHRRDCLPRFPQYKGGYQHILVITDHFTRYAQAVPTRNETAKTTAQALFDNYIEHLVYLKGFTQIREQTLRMKLSKSYGILQACKKLERQVITLWEIDSVSVSIVPY